MTQKRSERIGAGPGLRVCFAGAAMLAALALGGCGSSMPSLGGLFEEKETPLPGNRVAVLQSGVAGDAVSTTGSVEASTPVSLPASQSNAEWSQPGGAHSNAPGHLSVGGASKAAWSSDAGEGSSKRGRLTAVPVVAGGKIFTLDAEGSVTAFSPASGARAWRVSLRPEKEKARVGFGGGLAVDGGRLFAATGYGTVVALDPASGKTVWTKMIGLPLRNSPTAINGKVFVITTESQLYCLNAANGEEIWSSRGLPEMATMISNVSPAVSGNLVVVPFASGEVAAFDVNSGEPKWTDQITRGTVAGASFTAIGEPARPVIDGNAVYAVSRSGQMVAISKTDGERLWSKEITGAQTPWVAGDTIFAVDVSGKLMALAKKDGKTRWIVALPDAKTWSGPVLASGRLWLASDKGALVGVNATNGAIESKANIGGPVYIAPVVAGGRLYVLSDKASLIAMN